MWGFSGHQLLTGTSDLGLQVQLLVRFTQMSVVLGTKISGTKYTRQGHVESCNKFPPLVSVPQPKLLSVPVDLPSQNPTPTSLQ